jgi:hypothetical protein
LTLIFQWAIIVLERAMLILVMGGENPDLNLNQDQTRSHDYLPGPKRSIQKRQHVGNFSDLSAYKLRNTLQKIYKSIYLQPEDRIDFF